MNIKHSVITAAGKGQETLALQTMATEDGRNITVLEHMIRDLKEAGIEKTAVIIAPGCSEIFKQAVGEAIDAVHFIEQTNPRGYGDAILRARSFVDDAPFLHLVGDHLCISHTPEKSCTRQILETAKRLGSGVCGLQATHESQLASFGAIGGRRIAAETNLYEIRCILEKPTPTIAEQELIISGLRHGYYLCFFGMHVLPGELFATLTDLDDGGPLPLTPALTHISEHHRLVGCVMEGRRFDLASRHGLLWARLALALKGSDRNQVLAEMTQLLASEISQQPGPHDRS